MACCGRGNGQSAATGNGQRVAPAPRGGTGGPAGSPARFAVVFEYQGPTAMTVRGGASGKLYRFDRSGARLSVEARDVPSLRGVPRLREVG